MNGSFLAFAAMILLLGSALSNPTESGNDIAEYLFVVGGEGATDDRKTEIVSLTEGSAIPDCLDALSDHPNNLQFAAGGALPDAGYLPHVCGQYSEIDDFECWQYSPLDNTWTKTLTIPRDFGAGASAYHPGWGIIMSGGYGDDEVTTTKDGKIFNDLAPMPYSSYLHCVAGIDTNMIFITGLGDGNDQSFMYYKDTGEWVTLPSMPTGRDRMGCGVVRDGSGRAQVVVVGGEPRWLWLRSTLNTVEIYNVDDESWRTANNPFPNTISGMAVAQNEDTFFIVGGCYGSSDLDTIYRFEVSDESWTLMPNRMKYERCAPTAMMVNSSIFPTCE